jgi:Ulp1 family protease
MKEIDREPDKGIAAVDAFGILSTRKPMYVADTAINLAMWVMMKASDFRVVCLDTHVYSNGHLGGAIDTGYDMTGMREWHLARTEKELKERGQTILDARMIVVPIHVITHRAGEHWILGIIDRINKSIELYDSLAE